jgi:hypothetical protein
MKAIEEAAKKKKKRKKLFKLAAMETLVERNTFLQSKYEALSVNAEDKLGYHYNEVIHNILFNKYVKTDEELMKQYYQIKKEVEIGENREGKGSSSAPEDHPLSPDAAPAPQEVAPAPQETAPAPQETAPVKQAPVAIPDDAAIDTRLDEMETGDAGAFSYETPFFGFNGTKEKWMKTWDKRNKKADNNMKIIIPNTEKHTMGKESYKELKEEIMTNFELAGDIFESYLEVDTDKLVSEEKLPDAVIRVNSVQDKTKEDSVGYYKKSKEQIESGENVATGESASSDSLELDEIPKHTPTEEEEEFVELNRGNGLMDRVLQGLETEPDEKTMARYRAQAGDKQVDDALKQKKEVDARSPALAPPSRVKIVKEGVSLAGIYHDALDGKTTVVFNPNDAADVTSVNESYTQVFTEGMGNSYKEDSKIMSESYNFYIDLTSKEYVRVKKGNMLNESAQLHSDNAARFSYLIGYSPRKFERGK